MTSFRKLSIAATAATFLLVGIGGLVRATKSGLGCGTDWPHCSGRLIPSIENRAVAIEFSHRLMASVVVALIALLVVMAWRHYRADRRIVRTATAALGLVLVQALLGAIVVWFELEADLVVLHLAAAMTLVAVLIYLTVTVSAREGLQFVVSRTIARKGRVIAGAVFMLLLVGSYVTGRSAGYVFEDWPLMDGQLIPELTSDVETLHFIHRVMALCIGVFVVLFCVRVIRRRRELGTQARLARVAVGLYVAQVLLGAGNVFFPPPSRINEALVTMHLLNAALIWGTLVALAAISSPAVAQARSRSARRSPATERAAYEAG